MAIYDNNGNNLAPTTTNKRAPRTDYSTLIHNGIKYDTLDIMIDRIARERAKVAFKSTMLIFKELNSKVKEETIIEAMITANKKMIVEFLANRDNSDDKFGL